MYWVTTTCISCIAVPLIRDGESLYCHRSYELCNNAGGSQKLFNFIQKLYFHTTKQSKERKRFQKERESSLGLLSTCLLVICSMLMQVRYLPCFLFVLCHAPLVHVTQRLTITRAIWKCSELSFTSKACGTVG